ncbi:hypothetical protein [Streptomyces fumanus]|uniref:hypothetical protein n=1 Tax=Streptomyces fumanus TaxID=67302 RepID=UPI0033CC530C
MNGTTVVLTGATSGIGEAAARRFAATCDRLILHGPESRGDVVSLLGTLAADGRAELHHLEADLDDLDNVSRPATRTLDLDDIGLEHGYSPVRAYAQSKLAMVAHALTQAGRWDEDGPRIVSISPGVIGTRLLHAMFAVRGADPGHGARNVVEAATGSIPYSGAYLDDGRPAHPSAQARDEAFRARLATVTHRLISAWL